MQGTTTVTLSYDGEHGRVARYSSPMAVFYLDDPGTGAMQDYKASSTSYTSLDYLLVDGHIVVQRSCTMTVAACTATPAWTYFTGDHLGSTAALTGGTGAVVERDSYDPWGRPRVYATGADDPGCGSTPASLTTRHYTGHEQVASECLVNANARFYDPTVARFISADNTVTNPADLQDWNPYSYVSNRPLTFADPTGHEGCSSNGACGGNTAPPTSSEKDALSEMQTMHNEQASNPDLQIMAGEGMAQTLLAAGQGVAVLNTMASAAIAGDQQANASLSNIINSGAIDSVPVTAIMVSNEMPSADGTRQANGYANSSSQDSYGNKYGSTHQGSFKCAGGTCYYAMSSVTDSGNGRGARISITYDGSTPDIHWYQTYPATTLGDDGFAHQDCFASCPFAGPAGNKYFDVPRRGNDNGVWSGQTSMVVPNHAGGYTALTTFTWGFTLTPNSITPILPQVTNPSAAQTQFIGGLHQ